MTSDVKKSPVSETEDVSSDFFDDFSKEEFMEGLSVIDSWADVQKTASRIDSETVGSVKDLRELIKGGENKQNQSKKLINKYKIDRRVRGEQKDSAVGRSGVKRKLVSERKRNDALDELVKPGSRRDPTKTEQAIKKDKEEKVKEYLAKHLESDDDPRPPGTELDDYFEADSKTTKIYKKRLDAEAGPDPKVSIDKRRDGRLRRSKSSVHGGPSPKRRPSPPRRRARSPPRPLHQRHKYYHSRARRPSPARSPRRRNTPPRHRSRTPSSSPPPLRRRRATSRPHRTRSRSRTPLKSPRRVARPPPTPTNDFLYPAGPPHWETDAVPQESMPYMPEPMPYMPGPMPYMPEPLPYSQEPMPYSQGAPYAYVDDVSGPYPGAYVGQYGYGAPLPAAPYEPPPQQGPPQQGPTPVPPEGTIVAPPPALGAPAPTAAPLCALTKLFVDGKISKEDYLKLKPNKGVSGQEKLNLKDKVELLNRCYEAVSKLSKLQLPSRLVMPAHLSTRPKELTEPYRSPLKRHVTVEFQFTSAGGADVERRNERLVASVAGALGLERAAARGRRRATRRFTRDAAVQTTRPACAACEVREAGGRRDGATSPDRELGSRSTHTQVDEKELASTRTVFAAAGGGAPAGAPLSISHLTPAQLVSQLAARAKSLKQTDSPPPSSYSHRPSVYRDNYTYRY